MVTPSPLTDERGVFLRPLCCEHEVEVVLRSGAQPDARFLANPLRPRHYPVPFLSAATDRRPSSMALTLATFSASEGSASAENQASRISPAMA